MYCRLIQQGPCASLMSIRLQSCCTTKEKCAQSLLVHLRPKSHRGLIHFLNGSPTTRAFIVALRFSSSSSKRWQTRQGKDKFATQAKVQGLKSRAAFKLLEVGSNISCSSRRFSILFANLRRLTRNTRSFAKVKPSLIWSASLSSKHVVLPC